MYVVVTYFRQKLSMVGNLCTDHVQQKTNSVEVLKTLY